jgi:hypothetical protein
MHEHHSLPAEEMLCVPERALLSRRSALSEVFGLELATACESPAASRRRRMPVARWSSTAAVVVDS